MTKFEVRNNMVYASQMQFSSSASSIMGPTHQWRPAQIRLATDVWIL